MANKFSMQDKDIAIALLKGNAVPESILRVVQDHKL